MKIRYAVVEDTFKLVYGDYDRFHPELIDGMEKEIALCGGRNMRVGFQILVCADEPWALNTGKALWMSQQGPIGCVRLTADPGVTMNIEDMHEDDDRFFRADALLSQEVTEQPAGYTRAVYCEIDIPASVEPGQKEYKVKLFTGRMFEDEELVGEVKATVDVYEYTLKNARDQKFHLDLWQHSSNLARKHEVPLWSDEHFRILEQYVESMAMLGQKAVTLVVTEVPWGGQSCFNEYRMKANLFEYSIVPLTVTAEGALKPDFGPMQRYIDLCARYGIKDELSLYGLMNIWCKPERGFGKIAEDDPDSLRVRAFDEGKGCYRFLNTEAELEEYIRLLVEYFRKTGQLDRVRIAADEPADIEKYKKSLERMKRIAPDLKYKAAINHAEFIEEFGEDICDFVPYSAHVFTHLPVLQKYHKTMKGKRFLWYVCCGPEWPNTFICSDLCETLWIGAFTSLCGLDGFLRWNYTVFNDDPRKDIRYGIFHAGDTNFVYPSPAGKPLLTLRWKALRRAIWLYEMLEDHRAKYGDEKTDALIGTVVLNTETEKYYTDGHWKSSVVNMDHAAYDGLQKTLLEALSSEKV